MFSSFFKAHELHRFGQRLAGGSVVRHPYMRIAGAHALRSTQSRVGLMLVVLIGQPGPGTAQVRTDATSGLAEASREEVLVTAKRHFTDEQVTEQVEKVLTDDTYIYAEHVTVTVHNGVVRLEGIVGDTGERFRILRLCRKIPGARRIVDGLEMISNDPDGG